MVRMRGHPGPRRRTRTTSQPYSTPTAADTSIQSTPSAQRTSACFPNRRPLSVDLAGRQECLLSRRRSPLQARRIMESSHEPRRLDLPPVLRPAAEPVDGSIRRRGRWVDGGPLGPADVLGLAALAVGSSFLLTMATRSTSDRQGRTIARLRTRKRIAPRSDSGQWSVDDFTTGVCAGMSLLMVAFGLIR